MKIAMVSEHASPLATLGGVDAGGQNVHVAELARAVARHGHDVVVYTRRDAADIPRRVPFAEGVVVEHVDAGPPSPVPKDDMLPMMGEFARYLAAAWRRDRPDVVHAHFWMSGLAAIDAGRPLTLPQVLTFHALGIVKRRHQGDKDTSPPGRLDIEHQLLREVDHIVATSTDEVFELVRLGGDARRTTVVPCGVDLSLFHPDGPVDSRRPDVPRLVVVSRMVERKGIGNVIAAMPLLPDAELVVAGGPPREELPWDPEGRRLLALRRELGVEDRVDIRGQIERDEVPALMRSADVVVCAPWYEPFGMVAVEAMACGVPVVASAVGGLIDTVVDGRTGRHVPPRDPRAIAAAAGELLADQELRRRLGHAAVERARTRYGWDRVAESTLDVYAGVAALPATRAGRAWT
jgi:D-inositol-3-phosphate glycosyltransferase